MRLLSVILIVFACACSAGATTVVFTTDGISTGDSLDGIGTTFTPVSVVEIPDLTVSLATVTEGQTLNANGGDFGVNSALLDDVSDRFDYGESLEMFFNKDIQITKIDFSDFDSGETFNFIIGSVTNSIAWTGLSNTKSDFLSDISWDVSAEEIIRLEVASSGYSVSMDTLDITVVPEPAVISLIGLFGLLTLMVRRIFC